MSIFAESFGPVFGGVTMIVVESGTVVGQMPSGKDMVVTDDTAVYKGSNCWVTQKTYDAMKSKADGA